MSQVPEAMLEEKLRALEGHSVSSRNPFKGPRHGALLRGLEVSSVFPYEGSESEGQINDFFYEKEPEKKEFVVRPASTTLVATQLLPQPHANSVSGTQEPLRSGCGPTAHR